MERKRRKYTKEFKQEAVLLVKKSGKTVGEVAEDLGINRTVLSRWVKQYDIDVGMGPPGAWTTAEKEENRRLKRELRQVKMERDFLKKAATFFARENSKDPTS